MIARSETGVVEGTIESINAHDLEHEVLTSYEVRDRYRVFKTDEEEVGVVEGEAGWLEPEKCIDLHTKLARDAGADVRLGAKVKGFECAPEGDRVRLNVEDGGVMEATKVVFAVGLWTSGLLGDRMKDKLTVTRKVLHWFGHGVDGDKPEGS